MHIAGTDHASDERFFPCIGHGTSLLDLSGIDASVLAGTLLWGSDFIPWELRFCTEAFSAELSALGLSPPWCLSRASLSVSGDLRRAPLTKGVKNGPSKREKVKARRENLKYCKQHHILSALLQTSPACSRRSLTGSKINPPNAVMSALIHQQTSIRSTRTARAERPRTACG